MKCLDLGGETCWIGLNNGGWSFAFIFFQTAFCLLCKMDTLVDILQIIVRRNMQNNKNKLQLV